MIKLVLSSTTTRWLKGKNVILDQWEGKIYWYQSIREYKFSSDGFLIFESLEDADGNYQTNK